MTRTNQNYRYITSAAEVRAILEAAHYTKAGYGVIGKWSKANGETVRVGFVLASATAQSSIGASASWVYSLPSTIRHAA